MKGIMVVIKLFAAIAVLGVLGATAWYVKEVKDQVAVPRLEAARLLERMESDGPSEVEPVDLAFQRAVELVATGRYGEAEEKLQFIVNFDPGSEAADEARRILGEMHLDRLLSVEEMEGKEIHKVERGDSFLKIAKKYRTTLDCVMHLNGLQGLDRLHPGDELLVMPLEFNLKIDVPRKRVSIWKDGRFVKAYRVMLARIGAKSKGVVRAKVKNKVGYFEGRTYPTLSEHYREASKVLSVSTGGVQIREVPEEDGEDPGRGVFLREPDMEELVLLMRVGNEVEIRYTTP